MTTENTTTEAIILDTPEQILFFQAARIIHGIALEVNTTMKVSSRGNILDAARTIGLIPQGRTTKKAALRRAVATMKLNYPTWEPSASITRALNLK